MTDEIEYNIPKKEKKHNNGAFQISLASSLSGSGRKYVLFKATVVHNKETISPGRGLTKKSDTLHRPTVIYTGPALYCTRSLSNTGMSNISFSFKSC